MGLRTLAVSHSYGASMRQTDFKFLWQVEMTQLPCELLWTVWVTLNRRP